MSFTLLETIRFESFDEQMKFGFAENSKVQCEMREKYKGKNLSFQTSSHANKNEYLLNVFERGESVYE